MFETSLSLIKHFSNSVVIHQVEGLAMLTSGQLETHNTASIHMHIQYNMLEEHIWTDSQTT